MQATMQGPLSPQGKKPELAHGPKALLRSMGSGISQLSLSSDYVLRTPLLGLSHQEGVPLDSGQCLQIISSGVPGSTSAGLLHASGKCPKYLFSPPPAQGLV